jgi:arabinofuranosyltransferase
MATRSWPLERRWPLTAGLVLLAVVLLRTAWISDDAYISFRTIDNVLAGDGLRWNPDERVQAFTHPLWVLLLIPAQDATHEPYFTTLAISLLLSLGAAAVVLFLIADSAATGVIAVALLTLSRSFVDYSTSGLENPLSHVLLALLIASVLESPSADDARPTVATPLLAGLAVVTRMDLLLIVTPILAQDLARRHRRDLLRAVCAAFAPIAGWESFSLFYYGYLFPNTAYAKLSTGLPRGELAHQGMLYLRESFATDPITLVTIAVGVAIGISVRDRGARPAALGIVAYLLYVVSIGGDFMSGRFLSAPFLAAVCLVARFGIRPGSRSIALRAGMGLSATVVIGFLAPHPTLFSDGGYRVEEIPPHGIADERGVYYQVTGLLRKRHAWSSPRIALMEKYVAAIEAGRHAIATDFIGAQGYLVGRQLHIIDTLVLPDPLLSRLPCERPWRIGHFARRLPEGYFQSVQEDRNRIVDPDLAAYYDGVRTITRAPLWSWERIVTIVRMNGGAYDGRLRAYISRMGP